MESKENVDDSESIASDESEEMTEVDEDEFDHRRADCLAGMRELEAQFVRLKEELISERHALIEHKLKEIEDETADEFTGPLKQLQLGKDFKIKLATLMRDYRLQNIEHVYECEKISAKLTLENEKQSLLDKYKANIEKEIRQLEENRRQFILDYSYYQMCQYGRLSDDEDESNDAATTGDWERKESGPIDQEDQASCTKSSSSNKQAPIGNTATLTTPLNLSGTSIIVYSLQEYEILEDYSIIKMHKNLNRSISTEC